MFKAVSRTYPPPDDPRPHIGPRERALAVFKFLLDLEPEEAVKHPRFALIEHAFENQARLAQALILRLIHSKVVVDCPATNEPLPNVPKILEWLMGEKGCFKDPERALEEPITATLPA